MSVLFKFLALGLSFKFADVAALPNLLLKPIGSGVTTDPSTANGQTFDYIIVGGGLTGVTVASRLTEDPTISVLLVEAGADNRNDPRVYDIHNYGQAFHSEIDWSWPTDQGRSIIG